MRNPKHFIAILFSLGILLAAPFVPDQLPATATGEVAAAESGAKPLTIGDQTQLLVDDFLIAEKRNVTRQLGRVTKVRPVFKPDPELDGSISFAIYHTVLYKPHEEKFQLWYNVRVGAQREGIAYGGKTDMIREAPASTTIPVEQRGQNHPSRP